MQPTILVGASGFKGAFLVSQRTKLIEMNQMIEMTATVLLKYKEIIIALIAVFGAVVPYLLQKNKELNLKIAEQKREALQQFSEELH